MKLPNKKSPPKTKNARKILIYSMPKTGKTELLTLLENNLIIDLEGGTRMFESMTIEAKTAKELYAIIEMLRTKKDELKSFPYKFITLDTATALETIVNSLAIAMYKQTPMGKNYNGKDITTLPNGAGYQWIRKAFMKVIDDFSEFCETLILTAHLKDKYIDKNGEIVSSKDIDLQGKLKSIVCANMDAIGYLYRKEENENWLSFKTSEDIISGARPVHLSNKEFKISVKNDNNNLEVFWDKIFV